MTGFNLPNKSNPIDVIGLSQSYKVPSIWVTLGRITSLDKIIVREVIVVKKSITIEVWYHFFLIFYGMYISYKKIL
jgi:hypothetical protein